MMRVHFLDNKNRQSSLNASGKTMAESVSKNIRVIFLAIYNKIMKSNAIFATLSDFFFKIVVICYLLIFMQLSDPSFTVKPGQ